jgi:hypothetical protein
LCALLACAVTVQPADIPEERGAVAERYSPWRVPVLPRAYVHEGRGRRLSGEISGNLETLGYYAANVCIGSPGTMHQLIIDTGSSMTAVPCATCTTCGRHKNPKYNPSRSLTSERLGCKNPPFHMRCSRCERAQCGYSVSYTEGSQIRGAVFTDHMHFGDGPKSFTERMVVGCQTFETGLFKGQVADGMYARRPPRARLPASRPRAHAHTAPLLRSGPRARLSAPALRAHSMGISATRSGGLASPTPIDRLVEVRRIENTFSFCLADHSGKLILGGTVRPDRAKEVHWLPMRDQRFYSLTLNDMQLGGKTFGARALARARTARTPPRRRRAAHSAAATLPLPLSARVAPLRRSCGGRCRSSEVLGDDY